MEVLRVLVAIVFGAFAALMLYTTMTVPMISATAPALLTIASLAVAWFAWPKSAAERER